MIVEMIVVAVAKDFHRNLEIYIQSRFTSLLIEVLNLNQSRFQSLFASTDCCNIISPINKWNYRANAVIIARKESLSTLVVVRGIRNNTQ